MSEAMGGTWWAGDKTGRDPGSELNELRRAIAEMLETDMDTWPEHGNAPLAIAAAFARQRLHTKGREAERDELRAALRDLREYIYWPDRAAAYVGEDALRARIDALIGPYGEQGGGQ